MREHEAVAKARNTGDIWVLVGALLAVGFLLGIITLIAFVIALVAESQGNSDEGIMSFIGTVIGYGIFLAIILVLILVTIRMMRQMFLGNALQVEYSDYAWLRDWSNQVARDLNMPRVEIFVTQDPVINAFAVGFMRPYNIVLNSGAIRYLSHEELKAVVVHEMAHVKYGHTAIGAYLSVLRALPFIGGVASWIFDFWGRRAELTADRLALCYLRDPELVKNSLIKVHVGPDVAASFNDVARQWQVHNTNNLFNRLTQTFSSHPFLVRRIQHIDTSSYLIAPTPAPSDQV